MISFWFISTIIALAVLFGSVPYLEVDSYHSGEYRWEKFKAPRIIWILATLVCAIPILNAICVLVVLGVYIGKFCEGELRFTGGFMSWLFKEV